MRSGPRPVSTSASATTVRVLCTAEAASPGAACAMAVMQNSPQHVPADLPSPSEWSCGAVPSACP
jgi:hypothetical protein